MNDAPLILLFTDDPDRGGVAQYNHAILMALAGRGWRVACAQIKGDNPLIAAQKAAGVSHHWLPPAADGNNFVRSLSDMETPKALFTALRPDLILFSDCCPVSNVAARHTAMAMRIPYLVVVGFVAEYLAETGVKYLSIVARQYAQAREVVAVSRENLELLRSRFGLAADRGRVIHYGRPPEFFTPADPARRRRMREEFGIAADAVVALTAARLTEVKGYLYQLAAYQLLEKQGHGRRNHFVWLGEGEQRPLLEREIAARAWQPRFTLPGHCWNMAEWYDVADIFILPSGNEGMPLSIMEAMAKSLPVIASAVSGIPEELGPTGKLLPDPKSHPGEASLELAETLRLWTDNPELRRDAGAACRERALRMFREETMIEQTLEMVDKCLPIGRR